MPAVKRDLSHCPKVTGSMMGRYPHEVAELLMTVAITLVLWGLVLPLAGRLPSWAGVPLACFPLVVLPTVFLVFWYRNRK